MTVESESMTDSPSAVGRVPVPSRGRRIAIRALLALAVVVTVMCVALFAGMRINDSRIDDHLGTATATVLSVSALHTGIEFVDSQGATVRPAGGVLYPGLLAVGQQFVVEYDADDPAVVRVAGRTAAVGNVVIAETLAGSWLVAGGLVLWLRRPGKRRRPADQDVEASNSSTSSATSGTETTSPSSGNA